MADKVDDLMIKTLNKVSETGNITTDDIFVLKYCKHERAKQSQSPAYKLLYMLDAIAPAFEGEACRVIRPEITVRISGVDGTVSRVCLNVTRLA